MSTQIFRYTLTDNGMDFRPDGEFCRAIDYDQLKRQAEREVAAAQAEAKKANDEREELRRALGALKAECAELYAGQAPTMAAQIRELLEEYQWHWEPYDDHSHRDSGWYCPDCGADKHGSGVHKAGCAFERALRALLAGGEE